MIDARFAAVLGTALIALSPIAAAQEPQAPAAYPTRDELTPFRNPTEIMAPPDTLFAQLGTMRRIAEDPAATRSFGADGREVIDDETWRQARREAERIGIDAGMLAAHIRQNRNADQRATCFYAAFYCTNEEYVLDLVGHIPGEPERKTRERAYPRAIEFVRAHIKRTFGSLTEEEQKIVLRDIPQPGSPAANARGIKRLPQAGDLLFSLNLVPFYQLLDLDEPLDQAQALWFLAQCFRERPDLAQATLEPVLPRIRQLLAHGEARVVQQAIELLAAVGPKGLVPPAADASPRERDAYADTAIRALFPPIRRVSDGLLLLFPGPDRDAIVAAGRAALDTDRIGEGTNGKDAQGNLYRGFRVDRVPEALAVLGIPKGAVVTAINGVPVFDSPSLWRTIADQFFVREKNKDGKLERRPISKGRLFVDMIVGQEPRAMEYRVL